MYVDLVMLLNFLIDFLLLMGTNALSGFPLGLKRSAIAAAVGGVYGGACLFPGFSFLGNLFWRTVFLSMMAVIAFGFDASALRRGVLFILLSMALGGVATVMGNGGVLSVLAASAGMLAMCVVGFRGKAGSRRYVRVQLRFGGKSMDLTALCDTGNTLKDPVTGCPVLVVGSDVAGQLLGLTQRQLNSPLQTLTEFPGLRLIPYRSVGQPAGMLLGIRPDEIQINGEKREYILGFAPQKLGNEGYQALAGGIV